MAYQSATIYVLGDDLRQLLSQHIYTLFADLSLDHLQRFVTLYENIGFTSLTKIQLLFDMDMSVDANWDAVCKSYGASRDPSCIPHHMGALLTVVALLCENVIGGKAERDRRLNALMLISNDLYSCLEAKKRNLQEEQQILKIKQADEKLRLQEKDAQKVKKAEQEQILKVEQAKAEQEQILKEKQAMVAGGKSHFEDPVGSTIQDADQGSFPTLSQQVADALKRIATLEALSPVSHKEQDVTISKSDKDATTLVVPKEEDTHPCPILNGEAHACVHLESAAPSSSSTQEVLPSNDASKPKERSFCIIVSSGHYDVCSVHSATPFVPSPTRILQNEVQANAEKACAAYEASAKKFRDARDCVLERHTELVLMLASSPSYNLWEKRQLMHDICAKYYVAEAEFKHAELIVRSLCPHIRQTLSEHVTFAVNNTRHALSCAGVLTPAP